MALAERVRDQADACRRLGSPMYADLLDSLVDDLDGGGVSVGVLAGHENDPGPSALALRLLGSVHRMVLDGRAPGLARFYPSAGGVWQPRPGWRAFRAVLASQGDAVRERLDQPPQTNEVGRASALMGGLLRVGGSFGLPVRLFEIGSSAGLNLHADRCFYLDEDGAGYGSPGSPVRLEGAWAGPLPGSWPGPRIVERLGSDVAPVDVGSEEGRLALTSYVWPDQTARLERLRGALRLAAERPVRVRRQDAVSFVGDIGLVEGTTTVLWHSVMWQYLAAADQVAVTALLGALGASAREGAPFAHLSLEPARRAPGSEHEFLVVLELWPTGERRVLGTSAGHGLPTTWE